MKKQLLILTGFIACFVLSGCGLMELSFKSGFIMALIIAAIIGLLIWVLHFSRRLLGRYLLDSAGFKDAAVHDSCVTDSTEAA